jgi:hypothetical protein
MQAGGQAGRQAGRQAGGDREVEQAPLLCTPHMRAIQTALALPPDYVLSGCPAPTRLLSTPCPNMPSPLLPWCHPAATRCSW